MTKGDLVRYSDKYQLANPNSWRIGKLGRFVREVKGYPGCVIVRWENNLASVLKKDLIKVTNKDSGSALQRSLF